MSLAERVKSRYRKEIARVGEPIYIRRYSGSGTTRTHDDTSTTAAIRNMGQVETVGAATQYRYRVIALIDNLSAILPVTIADRVMLSNGKELAIVNPGDHKRRIGGTLIALEMECEG